MGDLSSFHPNLRPPHKRNGPEIQDDNLCHLSIRFIGQDIKA